jgi:molybdenum cofactor cytidylyltransferase
VEGRGEIWAIVLAAGEARRMQAPKMVLPFGELTVIETVIRNASVPGIDNIIVVTGGWKKEVTEVLRGEDLLLSTNENYKAGMFSSVQNGIRNLSDKAAAFMILHGDMPMVGQSIVNKLTVAFCDSGKGISIPVNNGKRGHPVMIDIKYKAEILEMKITDSLRDFMEKHSDDILEVESEPEILRDIDTREDYIKELKLKS